MCQRARGGGGGGEREGGGRGGGVGGGGVDVGVCECFGGPNRHGCDRLDVVLKTTRTNCKRLAIKTHPPTHQLTHIRQVTILETM